MSPTGAPVIRSLGGWAEFENCVALQESTWGAGFRERVPPSLMLVAQRTGGIAAGAFDRDALVGFVFGVSGFVANRPIHWSDMLAVRADLRDRGIGFALKCFQRDRMLDAGIDTIVWTADPLESRNAHFNFNKLGATAAHYERDVYGQGDSKLHRGIGTDRLIVSWPIATSRVERHLAGEHEWDRASVMELPPVNQVESDDMGPVPRAPAETPDSHLARLAVPADIQRLKEIAPGRAREWRAHIRDALERAFAAGYAATGSVRDGEVGWYVIERRGTAGRPELHAR